MSSLYDMATDRILYGGVYVPISVFNSDDPTEQRFIVDVFNLVRDLSSFYLNETETALMTAVVLMSPGTIKIMKKHFILLQPMRISATILINKEICKNVFIPSLHFYVWLTLKVNKKVDFLFLQFEMASEVSTKFVKLMNDIWTVCRSNCVQVTQVTIWCHW